MNGKKANIIPVHKKGDKQIIKKLPNSVTPAYLQQKLFLTLFLNI